MRKQSCTPLFWANRNTAKGIQVIRALTAAKDLWQQSYWLTNRSIKPFVRQGVGVLMNVKEHLFVCIPENRRRPH